MECKQPMFSNLYTRCRKQKSTEPNASSASNSISRTNPHFMWTIVLLAAAVLSAYLGFWFSRQKASAPPIIDGEQVDEPIRQAPTTNGSKAVARRGVSETLLTVRSEPALKAVALSPEPVPDPVADLKDYQPPSLDLLVQSPEEESRENDGELEKHKHKIVQTLKEFDIAITAIAATTGPALTLYEI